MTIRAMAFLALVVGSCAALAQENPDNAVQGVEFDANYFSSGSLDRFGVIVLSGSNGGKADDFARAIAERGYNTLSLAYFDRQGSPHVPRTLESIALEYFEASKRWLMNRTDTRDDGVLLFGLSKGAELALVLATRDRDYKAVVALAPSKVVWQGVPENMADIMAAPSSWSYQGEELPFVPYISPQAQANTGLNNRHAASLSNETAVQQALIRVERIEAPLLLLSGGRDESWPATQMAMDICQRARSMNGPSCTHIDYQDGDHLLQNHRAEMFEEVTAFLQTRR